MLDLEDLALCLKLDILYQIAHCQFHLRVEACLHMCDVVEAVPGVQIALVG